MVEITVTCDACGETMSTVDASNYLYVECDGGWRDDLNVEPICELTLRTAPSLRLGIHEWASCMYDGREHLLCGDCAEELHERVSQFEDEKDRVIKEFFGDA